MIEALLEIAKITLPPMAGPQEEHRGERDAEQADDGRADERLRE